MSKLRSYFAVDLDYLKASITFVLAKNAEGQVDLYDLSNLYHRLECVFLSFSNRDFSDLFRKN